MQKMLLLMVSIVCAATISFTQTPAGPPPGPSPREVVERLWAMATRGELLTSEGWNRASALFTAPSPPPNHKPILVVSNYYGVNLYSLEGDKAEVQMEYMDCGQIDSALRYSPPRKIQAYKTSFGYRLVSVPTYVMMYGSDGKTLVDKKPTGGTAWQIEGAQIEGPPPLPWTTVNTAIRYVLDVRNKTSDPTIKKNADETLTKLLKLH